MHIKIEDFLKDTRQTMHPTVAFLWSYEIYHKLNKNEHNGTSTSTSVGY